MVNSNLTDREREILNETGGDISYADLFLTSAYSGATNKERYIPPYIIDLFCQEVEQAKKNWERRNKV